MPRVFHFYPSIMLMTLLWLRSVLTNVLAPNTVAGDLANIILDPILIFVCKLGVSGAAIAHVISQ